MKIMICKLDSAPVSRSAIWPCAMCMKGVGGNFILCILCGNWVYYNRCSGIMGSLSNVMILLAVCEMKTKQRSQGWKISILERSLCSALTNYVTRAIALVQQVKQKLAKIM